MTTIICENLNKKPYGNKGEDYAKKWRCDDNSKGSIFYSKWVNLSELYSFEELANLHKDLFNMDIYTWNEPKSVFLECALIQLLILQKINKELAQKMYKDVMFRLDRSSKDMKLYGKLLEPI